MKKSSLNRKFRRALAASLGAVAFASTSCVINAVVDPMLYKQRDVAQFLANVGGDMQVLNLQTQNLVNAKHALGLIDIGGGQLLGCLAGYQVQKAANRDYVIKLTVGGVNIDLPVRLKRDGNQGHKYYRLCPNIDDPLGETGLGIPRTKVNAWVKSKWLTLYTALDTQIKNLEKAEADAAAKRAEENARAERERANSLLSSSGSQNVQVPSTNFNSGTMAVTGLTTAMIPMTTMMNNTTPVQTTTSSMVNTGNAMGTQAGPKANINNINPQINHNANVVEGKTKI